MTKIFTFFPIKKTLIILVISIFLIVGCSVKGTQIYSSPTSNYIRPSPTITQTSILIETKFPNMPIVNQIFFISSGGVYSLNIKAQEIKTIISDQNNVYSWLNQIDNQIYFLRTTDSNNGFGPDDIFCSNLDGSDFKQLTNDKSRDFYLQSDSNNAYLVYSTDTNSSENRYQLTLYNLSSKSIVTIIQNSSIPYIFPKWSPNNKNIAFFEGKNSNSNGKLYIYDLDNKQVTNILPIKITPSTSISWSPDSKKIVLGIIENNHPGIYTFDINSGDLEKIIELNEKPLNLQWSPDGKWILFEISPFSDQNDKYSGLYLLNLSSKEITQIQDGTKDGQFFSYQAKWSSTVSNCFEYLSNYNNDKWKIIIQNADTNAIKEIIFPEPYNYYPDSWVIIERK
jgi:hypothetical protein